VPSTASSSHAQYSSPYQRSVQCRGWGARRWAHWRCSAKNISGSGQPTRAKMHVSLLLLSLQRVYSTVLKLDTLQHYTVHFRAYRCDDGSPRRHLSQNCSAKTLNIISLLYSLNCHKKKQVNFIKFLSMVWKKKWTTHSQWNINKIRSLRPCRCCFTARQTMRTKNHFFFCKGLFYGKKILKHSFQIKTQDNQ